MTFVARGAGTALVALLAALSPADAEAQELAYCDMSIFEQSTKLEVTFANVVMAGERKKQGILLTKEMSNQRSSAFHALPIAFPPGTSLYVHFRIRISGTAANAPPNGAEGLTFIVQNTPSGDPLGVGKEGKGPGALGSQGGGMGYEGITQSFALEFDTSKQTDRQDLDGNHIALDLGGMVTHTADGTKDGMSLPGMPSGSSVAPFQPILLDAGQSLESSSASYDTRDVWIDYECVALDACTMKVFMTFNNATTASGFADVLNPSTLPKKPAAPVMTVKNLGDISSYLKSQVGFVGFSAATGANMDEHLVTYWVMGKKPLADANGNNLEDACECKAVPSACTDNLPACESTGDPTDKGFCRNCKESLECFIKDQQRPLCDYFLEGGSGACIECLFDAHCLNSEKPFCNPAVKECTEKCTDAAMCSGDAWCDNPTGEVFGGDCALDLVNGEPIPKSPNHTPPLEGVCTPDAAAVVCASRVCDATDNLCGYGVGVGPCSMATAPAVCRSGVCTANEVCGCTADSQCGGATSGKVCDTVTEGALNECVDGCRGSTGAGTAGNGCPLDLVCSSVDDTIGTCVKPATVPGPEVDGGCGCVLGAGLARYGAAGSARVGQIAALGMLAALAGKLARRRRRGK